MKLKIAIASFALVLSGPAFSYSFFGAECPADMGVLTEVRPLCHSFSRPAGSFTDTYTFSLAEASGGIHGDTTTIRFGQLFNLTLTQASLAGGTLASPLVDLNPDDGFALGPLGAGSYTLALSGKVTGLTGGAYAGHVSPAPEPETYAMMLLGFGMFGVALRKRQS